MLYSKILQEIFDRISNVCFYTLNDYHFTKYCLDIDGQTAHVQWPKEKGQKDK